MGDDAAPRTPQHGLGLVCPGQRQPRGQPGAMWCARGKSGALIRVLRVGPRERGQERLCSVSRMRTSRRVTEAVLDGRGGLESDQTFKGPCVQGPCSCIGRIFRGRDCVWVRATTRKHRMGGREWPRLCSRLKTGGC